MPRQDPEYLETVSLLRENNDKDETIAALQKQLAAKDARIAELEAGLERSKRIMSTILNVSSKAGIRTKQIECPHGIIPSYPSHAWWCDKCFDELEKTIWDLEGLAQS